MKGNYTRENAQTVVKAPRGAAPPAPPRSQCGRRRGCEKVLRLGTTISSTTAAATATTTMTFQVNSSQSMCGTLDWLRDHCAGYFLFPLLGLLLPHGAPLSSRLPVDSVGAQCKILPLSVLLKVDLSALLAAKQPTVRPTNQPTTQRSSNFVFLGSPPLCCLLLLPVEPDDRQHLLSLRRTAAASTEERERNGTKWLNYTLSIR